MTIEDTLQTYLEEIETAIENCDDTDFEEAVMLCSKMESYCTTSESFGKLAEAKQWIIQAFADNDVCEKAEIHLAEMKKLHNRFPDVTPVLSCYADALVSLQDGYLTAENKNLQRVEELYNSLLYLEKQYPQYNILENIAQAQYNYACYYIDSLNIEEAEKMTLSLKELSQTHELNRLVVLSYFYIIYRWLHYDCGKKDIVAAEGHFEIVENLTQIYVQHEPALHKVYRKALGMICELTVFEKQIVKANNYFVKLRKLYSLDEQQNPETNDPIPLMEALLELFNYYILEDELEQAKEIYKELKTINNKKEAQVAHIYARAVYTMNYQYAEMDDISEAAKYETELERLCSLQYKDEIILHLSGAYSLILASYKRKGDNDFVDIYIKKMDSLLGKHPCICRYMAITVYNLVFDYKKEKDYQRMNDYFNKLEELTNRFPDNNDLQKNYLDAAAVVVCVYEKQGDNPKVDNLYSKVTDTEYFPYSNNSLSHVLYNLSSIYAERHDIQRQEMLVDKLKGSFQSEPSDGQIVLRYTKALFNLLYDYSEKKMFEKTEEKYKELQSLYASYNDSDIRIDENPLGLEIAKRMAGAAFNYAYDMKGSHKKKESLFSFGSKNKKASNRIAVLIDDVHKLAVRWGEDSQQLQKYLMDIQKLK